MKKITISVIVMIAILLTACGNVSENDKSTEVSAEVTTTTSTDITSAVTTTSITEETSEEATTTTVKTENDDSSSKAETTAATSTAKKSTTTTKKSAGKVTSTTKSGTANNSGNGGGYSGGGAAVTQAPAQQQSAPTQQTTTTTQQTVRTTTTTTTTQYIPEPEPEPIVQPTSVVDIDRTDDQMFVFLTLYPIDYDGMYQAGQNLSYDGSDYGKARAVCEYAYNCGGRNCIEYALNAYFLAQGAGLECYLARSSKYDWNGHVANIVNIDGQYYYMEPQGNITGSPKTFAAAGPQENGEIISYPNGLDVITDIYDNRYDFNIASDWYENK
jgi:hypothetical protein